MNRFIMSKFNIKVFISILLLFIIILIYTYFSNNHFEVPPGASTPKGSRPRAEEINKVKRF